MEDAIIYVAGNPNAYPVEYYDEESGSYRGMIPELLKQFSEQSKYEIRYYEPQKGDKRDQWAENRQVDIISGCLDASDYRHSSGDEIVLLRAEENGESVVYQLLVTEVAPVGLAEDLSTFLSNVTQEVKTGFLLTTAYEEQPVNRTALNLSLVGILIVFIALITTIVLLVRHYRRRLRTAENDKETDEVTGLGNKDYLLRYAKSYLNDQNKVLYTAFYFHVDTERLDRLGGRSQTNEFLRHVAVVLRDRAADADILARISDGGFVLLRLTIDDLEGTQWLSPVLDRLRDYSVEQDHTGSLVYAVSSYRLRKTDQDLDQVLFDLSQCAQEACRVGEEYRPCTDEVLRAMDAQRQIQSDLKRGLANREFQLYIQFYVSSQTGKIAGGKALSRWQHPARGLLLPSYFVPLLEREHLVDQLDYCSLENACRFLSGLQHIGRRDFPLSCSFSRETFSSPDFPERCREIIEKFSFPRHMLILELTEGDEFLSDPQIANSLQKIRDLGVGIALDDLGEGFVSFAGESMRPFDILKVDRKLIAHIGTPSANSVLRATFQMAHELGAVVLAIGVESELQVRFLWQEGCDLLQGYCFYHPLPEWDARRQLLLE